MIAPPIVPSSAATGSWFFFPPWLHPESPAAITHASPAIYHLMPHTFIAIPPLLLHLILFIIISVFFYVNDKKYRFMLHFPLFLYNRYYCFSIKKRAAMASSPLLLSLCHRPILFYPFLALAYIVLLLSQYKYSPVSLFGILTTTLVPSPGRLSIFSPYSSP